ncbi:MAG: sn-glycerol-3-phosphate ABC transporter ATP-binding protein UgpC [Bauldia litoralis]
MADVVLKGIRKSFGPHEVIPSLDLEIRSGEFLVLVGPSGCGKSSLLRIIAGLEGVNAGTISVDGDDVTGRDPGDRDMAMVFQSYALYPHMTVAENLTFALRMRKTDEAEVMRRLDDALRMLSLQGYEDRKPGQLSGGQRQRVAMGRAIVRQPRVFLFDEPLSNLDAKLRASTRLELRELHDKLHATSVFVTHDQIEAMTMADRIVLLDRGRIQQIDPPKEIYRNPRNRFVASFIGSPEMNFLEGTLEMSDGAASFGGLPLPLSERRAARIAAAPRTAVELGIRPEHVDASRTSGDDRIELRVVAVEFTGQDAFVTGTTTLGRLTIRLDLHKDPDLSDGVAAGDTLYVRPTEDDWHLFDGTSGDCLTHG